MTKAPGELSRRGPADRETEAQGEHGVRGRCSLFIPQLWGCAVGYGHLTTLTSAPWRVLGLAELRRILHSFPAEGEQIQVTGVQELGWVPEYVQVLVGRRASSC